MPERTGEHALGSPDPMLWLWHHISASINLNDGFALVLDERLHDTTHLRVAVCNTSEELVHTREVIGLVVLDGGG